MKAVNNYKHMIDELAWMLGIFVNAANSPFNLKRLGWTEESIEKYQRKVQASTDMADKIKDELIGDGDETKFVGRLKTAFFELEAEPCFAPSYFPMFDGAKFEDSNRELFDALSNIFGGHDAFMIMTRLESICSDANFIVQSVSDMLDNVCKFVGYTPEPQYEIGNSPLEQQPEPQQEQGNYQREQQSGTQQAAAPEGNQEPQQVLTINNTTKEKMVFGWALEKEYMELINGCYKWKKSKSLLAYMCGRLYCGDRVKVDESDYSGELIKGKSQLPRQELKLLFNIDVGNNRDQLKTPPKQYYLIDNLFKR